MSLSLPLLESLLLPFFTSPPPTVPECAALWADIMNEYVTPIVPASTTVTTASAALEVDLIPAFTSGNMDEIQDAFVTFATTVGTGMAGFVATPPGPIDMTSAPQADTQAEAAANWAGILDAWLKTGIATPVVPGPPVPWS